MNVSLKFLCISCGQLSSDAVALNQITIMASKSLSIEVVLELSLFVVKTKERPTAQKNRALISLHLNT